MREDSAAPPTLTPAAGEALGWARTMVARHHYLRKAPDPRSRPFAYVVTLAGERVGCLFFGRPESTCCYAGDLTYGSPEDLAAGRAAFDRWELLNLSRVWLSPDVQPGGRLCSAAHLPGFADRAGVFRSTLASTVIRDAIARVGFDYLRAHPPCFVEDPYQVRAVLSYCDTKKHRGVIYRAAGFTLARRNAEGIETWWTPAVSPLSAEEDRAVRELAACHPRSRRLRESRRSLFDFLEAPA